MSAERENSSLQAGERMGKVEKHSSLPAETSSEKEHSSLLAGATKAASYNMVLQVKIQVFKPYLDLKDNNNNA